MNKQLIIVNPASGQGTNADSLRKIEEAARKLGFRGKVVETTKKVNAYKIAQDHIKEGVSHFIVCGGDGTVMEAVGALINKKAELSVIPLGTGNIFALNLNIPLNTEEAMKKALKGTSIKIDIGRANNVFFGVNAGMGFDADMMKLTSRQEKNKWGLLAYIKSGIKLLPRSRQIFTIKIDDKKPMKIKARSVMVANMEKTAGGIKAVPGANPKSGILNIGIIKARSLTDWLNIFYNAIMGKVHKSSRYDLYTGRHIEIIPKKSTPYQCDGNVFPATKTLKIDIYTQALTIKL